MTPEEKSLLERTYALAEENNSILRSLRRANRVGLIMRVLYWVVIIGIAVGALYFLQPYVESLMGVVDDAQEVLSDVTGSNTASNTPR